MPPKLTSLWGTSSDDVWALSSEEFLVHWDGAHWKVAAIYSLGPVSSIWGSGAGQVWAVGQRLDTGVLLKYQP